MPDKGNKEAGNKRIDLGVSGHLREGMSANMDQKAMTGKGTPQAAVPPPKPPDAASSAKPKQ
jgi:hypothetical protein